ncbi:MAG: hypothetical protein CXR31_12635 [Geobacter sp.]|nr:MAG: hypothetical protein CXR31_12635 [Geobacter sp.]
MKTIPLITACIVSSCFAGTALAAPELAVDQPVHDFGTVVQGKKVDHIFKFRNRGDATLNVIRVRTSCGCTAANVTTKALPPGGKSELTVTFDSSGFGGNISKLIYIETNDPQKPVTNLTLKGNVAEEISVTPRQLNFGTVKTNESKGITVTVSNQGSKPLKLTGAKSPLPQVRIKTGKTYLKPGETTTLSVTVTPRAEDRFLSGYLTITTDNSARKEIVIPLYGSLAR